MTAAEDHKQADPMASPQQVDPAAASLQEAPQSKRAKIKTSAEPSAALHQEETTGPAREDDKGKQPTPPDTSAAPQKTRPLPERMLYERQAPASTPSVPAAPAPGPAARLTDIDWMPPAEDQVARFLTSMADITPPPAREREGAGAPGYIVPSATSPEAVKRKKAKAEPFWSQVVATPMEQPTPPSRSLRPLRATRKRLLTGKGWLMLIGGILVLLVLALTILLLTHPGLLPK